MSESDAKKTAKSMKELTVKIVSSKKSATEFLKGAGILTKGGNVSPHYKKLEKAGV
jgi:hypothetical protein